MNASTSAETTVSSSCKPGTHSLRFVLPDGDVIAAHAHITEVGRIDKTFIDCGGTVRKVSTCSLQAWVADDTDHRLEPGQLATILDRAAPILSDEDLDVEIEYEDCQISQFPVRAVNATDSGLEFHLGTKHTDCLAKDVSCPMAPGNVDVADPTECNEAAQEG